ncbi:MAG: PorP/SprF family type IX secretion system membrane protein [Chitinophagaceae bacterium]
MKSLQISTQKALREPQHRLQARLAGCDGPAAIIRPWLRAMYLGFCLWIHPTLHAQDPAFSQFFSSPLNINPALTGNIISEWRVISNMRSQWMGPVSPYQTATVSFDGRPFKQKLPENSMVGIGAMLMTDRVMAGAIAGNFASLNAAYNLKVAEGYNGEEHQLGIGIGGIFGHRRVDYTKLNFGEQFNGRIFDTNLPTGQTVLSQMRPYFSSSAGIIYSQIGDTYNLDVGYAQFHANRPRQSFLEDDMQVLPVRHVAHVNFERYLSEVLVLNTNAIYQRQSTASYLSVGAALGYYLSSTEDIILNAGLWYWSKNAVVPYVGYVYRNFQIGFSYDVTVSKFTYPRQRPRTWELSLIMRGDRDRNRGVIACPWK